MNILKYLFISSIILYACTPAITQKKPRNYREGLKWIALDLSKKIKEGKRVVVLNFTSPSQPRKEVPALNIYLAHLFSSYLSEASKGRFTVIDREKGEKVVNEDLKFEVGERNWEEILNRFKCDYYVIGGYNLLPSRKLEVIDISLMEGPKKVFSKSQTFILQEAEYQELKDMAYGDAIEQIIENAIEILNMKKNEITNPILRGLMEMGITGLNGLLNRYRECKADPNCNYEIMKSQITGEFLENLDRIKRRFGL